MKNEAFWSIADSPVFRKRWHGQAHPLLKECAGSGCHHPETLRIRLASAIQEYETGPKVGMSAWARKNSIAVIRDRLRQAQWVYDHAHLYVQPANGD